MNKTNSIFTITLAIFFMIGCNSETDTQATKAKDEKIRVSHSSLGVLEKSLNNDKIEINLKKGEDTGKFIQFFIDSDRDKNTGYKNHLVDGADYLIEDDRVYKSTADGSSWNWKKIATAEFINDDERFYVQSTTEFMPQIVPDFRVAAISLLENWEISSNITMTALENDFLTIDGDASDWQGIPILANSSVGDFKVIDDDKNIYFLIHKGDFGKHSQIYINSDKDTNTGYSTDIVKGADYVIEDNRLYKSTANSNRWSFEHIGYVEFAKDNNLVEISIQKDKIGLNEDSTSIQAGVIGWDQNFVKVAHIEMQFVSLNESVQKKKLIISEVMAVNAHTVMDPDFLAFSDWIEIHNQSDEDIDISSYKLSDNLNEGKWTIPLGSVLASGEYMIFWADEEDIVKKGYHTNFKLKNKGEAVGLFDRAGELVDGFSFTKQKADISYNKSGYMSPTPKRENSTAIRDLTLSLKPTFSLDSGFYYATQSVSLNAKNEAVIHYTTDGSYPSKNSAIYTEPFTIDKTTIIRSFAFEDGKLPSEVVTKSYFIDEETNLPVVSIVTDDSYFFDNEIGIYTIGTNGTVSPGCGIEPEVANFYQNWRRPANIEYFDKNKKIGFSQEVDIKISGSCSRAIPQKSLSIKANSKYGKNFIEYKLFPNKNITKFKGFKLRSSGQDWYSTMLRDAFMQQVIKDDLDVDYQDYRPSIVYINGKYWGIHNIREKKNEDFLAENYPGLDDKKVDILENSMKINEGGKENYQQMISYIQTYGLESDVNYDEISTKMDIENYIDYIIAQTYFANVDWPYENIRYWREQKDGAKWRWIIEDLDLALGAWGDPIRTNMFFILTTTNDLIYRNPPWSTFLFRSLLKNANFKNRFKQKYHFYLSSTFSADRMILILDNLAQNIRDEIPRHSKRWGGTHPSVFKNIQRWEISIEHIKKVIRGRNDTVRSELESL